MGGTDDVTIDSRVEEMRGAPVTIADERVGVNDAVAAVLTRWVGSMPALYTVLAVFTVYMALAVWVRCGTSTRIPFRSCCF
ncbi:hypothetical protein ACIRRA_04480 [Nocardia sp. NPDC101769]|uniref:hypothetical protein n=1 Tax=Nocardia sp. NPDC101769 TaxID=3364333 RepID=UPI00380A5BAD